MSTILDTETPMMVLDLISMDKKGVFYMYVQDFFSHRDFSNDLVSFS